MQPSPPLKIRKVWSGPAPRSVTLPLLLKMIAPDRLKVPALSFTTWLLPQFWIALLIWPADAPGLSVAQTVVRFGMPPETPAWLQSMRRLDAMIVDCACALAAKPAHITTNRSDAVNLMISNTSR